MLLLLNSQVAYVSYPRPWTLLARHPEVQIIYKCQNLIPTEVPGRQQALFPLTPLSFALFLKPSAVFVPHMWGTQIRVSLLLTLWCTLFPRRTCQDSVSVSHPHSVSLYTTFIFSLSPLSALVWGKMTILPEQMGSWKFNLCLGQLLLTPRSTMQARQHHAEMHCPVDHGEASPVQGERLEQTARGKTGRGWEEKSWISPNIWGRGGKRWREKKGNVVWVSN